MMIERAKMSVDQNLLIHSREKIVELDGLRGIAILLVLLWHYLGVPLVAEPVSPLGAIKTALILGRSGVDLFFVLSGFLITGILLDNRRSKTLYSVFYLRRLLRIAPLYMLLVLLFLVFRGQATPVFDPAIPLWSYGTFTQNYAMATLGTYGAVWLGGTWSLAIEEQFYLIFPTLVRLPKLALHWLLAGGILAAPLLRIVTYFYFDRSDWAPYTWLPCRMDSLCWGGALACAFRQPNWVTWVRAHRGTLTRWLGAWTSGAIFLDLGARIDIGWHFSIWGHTYLAILYCGILLCTLAYRGQKSVSWLRAEPLGFLGRISYGVYLLHSGVLWLTFLAIGRTPRLGTLRDLSVVICSATISLAICTLSYRAFETPLLKLAHRLKYR